MNPLFTEQLAQFAPVFVLVAARAGGMVLAAPVFGSAAIPGRVRFLIAILLAVGIVPAVAHPAALPPTSGAAVVSLACEAAFGIGIGLSMRLLFAAVQWAGELLGQQMGLGLAGVFDPNWGEDSTPMGGLYTLLTLVVFLIAGGHRAMLGGLRGSFDSVPLMTAAIDRSVIDMLLATFQISMSMLLRLAAPMLVTMLVVDFVIAFVARTVPQMANFGGGITLRPIVGIAVLALGVVMSADVIVAGIKQSMWVVENSWGKLAGT